MRVGAGQGPAGGPAVRWAASGRRGGIGPPGGNMTSLIDSDTHLYEPRDMWRRYADPKDRELAITMESDELGYVWLMLGDRRLRLAGPHRPKDVDGIGVFRQRWLQGLPSEFDYDAYAEPYSNPAARLAYLDETGFAASVMFPNYGITWEGELAADLRTMTANMAAWNRWIVDVVAAGEGRLHPVAHLTLRDLAWFESQLEALAAGGVRLAMIPPALVNGKRLSDPELDRVWAAFVDHGITPCFHVANQPRPFDEAWYGEDLDQGISPLSVVFIWTGAALSLTDLILNGVFERYPDLRVGIMELGARWVPLQLQLMDGGYRHTARFNGEATPLTMAPSEYFRRQVRVAAFAYEHPSGLMEQGGDIFMACSDYPHTEGTDTPVDDYAAVGLVPDDEPALFSENAAYLLRL